MIGSVSLLPRLLLITDRRQSPRGVPWAVREALSAAPPGGVGVLLREKDLPGRELLKLARELRSVTAERGAALVINGRADIAIACEAEGVHLGGDAPPCLGVREACGQEMWIGVSLHAREDAPPGATYALLSPIFPTPSKPGAAPLGLGMLRDRCRTTALPLFALGGVTWKNAGDCLDAGASGVATLGGVLTQPDPARSLTLWMDSIRRGHDQA